MSEIEERSVQIIGVDFGSAEVAIEDGVSTAFRIAEYEGSFMLSPEGLALTRPVKIEDGFVTEVELDGHWAKLDRPA